MWHRKVYTPLMKTGNYLMYFEGLGEQETKVNCRRRLMQNFQISKKGGGVGAGESSSFQRSLPGLTSGSALQGPDRASSGATEQPLAACFWTSPPFSAPFDGAVHRGFSVIRFMLHLGVCFHG